MKNKIGKVTIILLVALALTAAYMLTPTYAVVRSYDNDVRTVSMTSVMTGSTDQLFTVTGGRIEIISLFGECTVVIASSPGNMTIQLDEASDPNYDRAFSTVVSINSLGLGDVIRFSNAIDIGILRLTANEGAGQTLSWFCSPGEIEQTLSSTGTGAIKWYLSYRKLESGSLVKVSEN